jgi:hypothetical protein
MPHSTTCLVLFQVFLEESIRCSEYHVHLHTFTAFACFGRENKGSIVCKHAHILLVNIWRVRYSKKGLEEFDNLNIHRDI